MTRTVKPVDELTLAEARLELDALKKDIELHDDLYYNESSPSISDAEYDSLRRRLRDIESRFGTLVSPDSPSQRVGAPVAGPLSKIPHTTPMLSLDNAFDRQDVERFLGRVSKLLAMHDLELCVEQKIDGLSASIIYEDGVMRYGVTRGDGLIGEDVTQNLKTVKGILNRIKCDTKCEIRGEVYMSKESFRTLNEGREMSGEQVFATPRNAASGSLRQLDPSITSLRDLRFFPYYLNIFGGNDAPDTQIENLELLTEFGFVVPEYRRCVNINEIIDYYEDIARKRQDLPYDIDGIVL